MERDDEEVLVAQDSSHPQRAIAKDLRTHKLELHGLLNKQTDKKQTFEQKKSKRKEKREEKRE